MDMGAKLDKKLQNGPASGGKAPRTPRGERTLRKILDAAREEFGERGFADSSIVGITQRAGVALGTFYTYFDSKEVLFQALVRDILNSMSEKKRNVFILFELEGLPGAEVAEMVGCPLDTMWTRLFHARREFRSLLAARGYNSSADLESIPGLEK